MESLRSPWGLPLPAYNLKLSENRSRFASSLEIRSTCPANAQQDLLPRRQRSPSLPPILKAQTQAEGVGDTGQCFGSRGSLDCSKGKYRYEEVEGETSGYASEAAPQSSPELWRMQQNMKSSLSNMECQCEELSAVASLRNQPIAAWQFERRNSETSAKRRIRREVEDQCEGEVEGEARPKWGDRGVAAGRLWEPHEGDQRLPQTISKGPPSWVERGLSSMDSADPQLVLIEHMSSSSSIENFESKSGNPGERLTYLLGQNVPIESSIKAERECKRLKALELQAAIVQQLEERELKKKAEKERRRKEEMEEEERFKKQKELELKRLQEERKLVEEKQQREQKRAEALKQALEKAEQQAKLEKENKKIKKLRENFDSMSINSESIPPSSPKNCESQQSTPYKESKLIQNIYIEQAFSPRRKLATASGDMTQSPQNISSETNIIMSNPQSAKFTKPYECCSRDENKTYDQSIQQVDHVQSNMSTISSMISDNHKGLVPASISQEILTPVHIGHTGAVQMAFLLPQHVYQCMHPVSMQPLYTTDVPLQQHINFLPAPSQTDTDDTSSNRILTPSKYRNPNTRDVYTQTDFNEKCSKVSEYQDAVKTKSLVRMDEITDQNTSDEKLNILSSRKEKRSLSEDKYRELENRPKWGVNKPPTQYKKQSEKDIFYTQKRKLRSRKRIQEKQYTSHSSDENRSPSPQESPKFEIYRKLERNRVQNAENYWKKCNSKTEKVINVGNVCVESSEISLLECDKTGTVRVCPNPASADLNKIFRENAPQTKRLTLSQKFMNDKYGNPKIWNNDDQKHNIKKDLKDEVNSKLKEKLPQRKSFLENINRTKNEQSKYYCEPDLSTNKPVILDQLKTLKDSLKKQQQIWGKYDFARSRSPNNERDLEVE